MNLWALSVALLGGPDMSPLVMLVAGPLVAFIITSIAGAVSLPLAIRLTETWNKLCTCWTPAEIRDEKRERTREYRSDLIREAIAKNHPPREIAPQLMWHILGSVPHDIAWWTSHWARRETMVPEIDPNESAMSTSFLLSPPFIIPFLLMASNATIGSAASIYQMDNIAAAQYESMNSVAVLPHEPTVSLIISVTFLTSGMAGILLNIVMIRRLIQVRKRRKAK